MSRLNPELGLLQGIGLLSTSLLGTGIFVIPALAATAAGEASLWAWMLLIALVLPVAFTFAQLGRHFPHAGGAPHLMMLFQLRTVMQWHQPTVKINHACSGGQVLRIKRRLSAQGKFRG